MATATAKKSVTEVTLALSKDEAETLAVILAYVTGSAMRSPVKHARAIGTALAENQIYNWKGEAAKLLRADRANGVHFKNYEAA